jgi:N-acetylglucosamine-6-sulfatase
VVSLSKPNILFIMSDDHTAQAIGAYGGHLADLNPTPTIDRLAAEGMRFDRVFCHNSICTPSRANILTGQYSQRNGVLILGQPLPPERQTLPIELKKAGYQTAVIGKWHLRAEPASFDYYCVLPGQGDYYDPTFRVRGDQPWPASTIQFKGAHSSDAITDLTLDWLKNERDPEKPFFLMHHYKAPHDMFDPAPRYDSYLAEVTIPSPHNRDEPIGNSAATQGMGAGLGKESPWRLGERLGIDPSLPGDAYRDATYQRFLKQYLRCVKGVDDNLQRLLEYLEANDLLENTVILYTGDQGYWLGERDLMDKRWMYEESMRMPFIVHWPKGLQPGQVNDWLINNTDFAPTILELAGAEIPESMQGRSFAGALRGEAQPADWREVTYYRYWMHMAHNLRVPAHFGIRSDCYKLIFFYGVDVKSHREPMPSTPAAWEFYDLENDPHETTNLYEDPGHQELIAKMKQQLKDVRAELDETDVAHPQIQKVIDAHWDD